MTQEYVEQLLEISIALASEKNREALLERILTVAMDLTNCDGGTLYIKDGDSLAFKVMITKSKNILQGGRHGKISLPPVALDRSNVCAYSVLEGKLINIPDVYDSDLFDFAGPLRYDALTGYKTTSMMVVPMENDLGETIGVMQLINAQNSEGEITPFGATTKVIVKALASQAAICLTNMNYILQVEELMESIVRTISAAIHLRSPYNVTHTHNMVLYAHNFITWLNNNKQIEWKIPELDERLFILSIWLHDIGKLITPLEIMNKATRLGDQYDTLMAKLDYISLSEEVIALRNGKDPTPMLNEVEEVRAFIQYVNNIPYLDDDTLSKVNQLARKTYSNRHDKNYLWFTKNEIDCLSIRKGTLTNEERTIMQDHVVLTEKILSKMSFWGEYTKIPKWASAHHELMDGSGYPKKLISDEIDKEARLLTVLDIFDGLTSHDRPYKEPFPIDKALSIMQDMVNSNQLDKYIFDLFVQSKSWEISDTAKSVKILEGIF